MDLGLLVARVVFGVLIAAHGAQKLFGWYGGYGLTGTGGFFEGLGFRPGRLFAALAGLAEWTGGILLALGFLEPVGAALVLAVMIVAIGAVHLPNGVLGQNGMETPLLYAAAAVALALTGPGAFSLDAALGVAVAWTAAVKATVLLLGVAGGLANLIIRRTHPQPVRA